MVHQSCCGHGHRNGAEQPQSGISGRGEIKTERTGKGPRIAGTRRQLSMSAEFADNSKVAMRCSPAYPYSPFLYNFNGNCWEQAARKSEPESNLLVRRLNFRLRRWRSGLGS